jgi:hypothetical protein
LAASATELCEADTGHFPTRRRRVPRPRDGRRPSRVPRIPESPSAAPSRQVDGPPRGTRRDCRSHP